jgi:hypothetical protein
MDWISSSTRMSMPWSLLQPTWSWATDSPRSFGRVAGLAVGLVAKSPQLYGCIPKCRSKIKTVFDSLQAHAWARDINGTVGIQEIGKYLLLWRALSQVLLTDQADTLVWKWTSDGTYSASSCYKATFHRSTSCRAWCLIM